MIIMPASEGGVESPLVPSPRRRRSVGMRRQASCRISGRVLRKSQQQHNNKNTDILPYNIDEQKLYKCLLSTVDEWEFNIFTLDKLTNGRALFHMSLHLFQEYNFIETFELDFVKLMRCITLIEEGYHGTNPYHNAVHAADVAQAMHCYLQENKLAQHLSPLEKMTAILSAITHDLDHPGVNQSFLIATSNPLASLYNNTSVLESHHWRTAMGTFYESGIFDHFSPAMWRSIEWQLKSLILATDITRQQEFLSRLKNHLDKNDLDLNENEEHRNFLLQIALKCADICNPCRPWEISKRWSESVCDEFFKQGDYERKLQLPVTPLCDRYSTTVAKIQSGFMQFVVMPLFSEWKRFTRTPLSRKMFENIHTNKASWDGIIRTAEAIKAKEQQVKPETVPEESEEEEEEEEDLTLEEEEKLLAARRARLQQEVEVTVEDIGPQQEEISSPGGEETPQPAEALTPEEMEDMGSTNLPRRHSLPPPMFHRDSGLLLHLSRRESFPRSQAVGRRHSLPAAASPYSSSFDRLVDKLSTLTECSPNESNGNGSHFDFGERPMGMNVMSVSLDTTTLSSARWEADKQTSAHGMDPAPFAQRPYTSEPQIPVTTAVAQTAKPHGSMAHPPAGHRPNNQVTVAPQKTEHSNTNSSPSSTTVGHTMHKSPSPTSSSTHPLPGPNTNSTSSCCSRTAITDNNSTHHTDHILNVPIVTVSVGNHHPDPGFRGSGKRDKGEGDMETQPLLMACADLSSTCSGEDNAHDLRESASPPPLANHYTGPRHHSLPMVSLTTLPCQPHRHSIATPTISGSTLGMDEETPLLQDLIRISQDESRLPADTASQTGDVTSC